MVGRDEELATLARALDAAIPAAVLVTGEAGIGKTHLVRAALAGREARAFVVRAHEESRRPFAVLREIVRRCGRDGGTAGAAASSAEEMVDTVEMSLSAMLDTGEARESPPPFVVVEDLHWADPDTLDLIPRLEERLHARGVGFVGTYRGVGISKRHRVRWVRSELRRTGRLVQIGLRPLFREASMTLARSVASVARASAEAIYSRSRGVPFYVRELAVAVAAQRETGAVQEKSEATLPMPESVRDAIAAQLETLPEEGRDQLFLAALLGNDLDATVAAELGADPDWLVESGFVEPVDEEVLRFRHSIVRDAVRSEIPWGRRRTLHSRIGAYLERTAAHPSAIAAHWLAAGKKDEARGKLVEAMHAAAAVGAYRDAGQAASDALRVWPDGDEARRVEVLQTLARSQHLSGELAAAEKTFRTLADHPVVRRDPEQEAMTNRTLANVRSLLGDERGAFNARRTAQAAFQALGREAEAAAELLQQLPMYVGSLRLTEAVDVAREAAKLAAAAGRVDIQARSLGLQGHLLAMAGRLDEGRTAAEEAFALAATNELSIISAEAYRRLGGVMEYSSDFRGAAQVYDNAVAQCERLDAEAVACDAMGCMAYVLYRIGDYARSIHVARRILGSADAPAMSRATALAAIAFVQAERGQFRSSRQAIERAEEFARSRGFSIYTFLLHMPRAILLAAEARHDEVAAEYTALLDAGLESHERHDALPGLCRAAAAFADRRDFRELGRTLDFVSTVAAETGNPEAVAVLSFAVASAARARGELREAGERYEEAATRLRDVGVPVEEALAHLYAGICRREAPRGDEGGSQAAAHFEAARSIARRIGARPLLALVEAANAGGEPGSAAHGAEPAHTAAGALSRASSPRGESVLSPRQVDVVRCLVAGLSNKEIASRLYISTRTAEMHVAHVLDRLNCRSRAEAAARAVELGLAEHQPGNVGAELLP